MPRHSPQSSLCNDIDISFDASPHSILQNPSTMNSPFICLRCSRALQSQPVRSSYRTLATAVRRKRDTSRIAHPSQTSQDLPRWSQTPPAMQMPIRLRPQPKQPEWRVNDQPEVLDEMYDRFIGRAGESAKGQDEVESTRGRDLLPEEIKVPLQPR